MRSTRISLRPVRWLPRFRKAIEGRRGVKETLCQARFKRAEGGSGLLVPGLPSEAGR